MRGTKDFKKKFPMNSSILPSTDGMRRKIIDSSVKADTGRIEFDTGQFGGHKVLTGFTSHRTSEPTTTEWSGEETSLVGGGAAGDGALGNGHAMGLRVRERAIRFDVVLLKAWNVDRLICLRP